MGDIFCECFILYHIFLVYLAGMKKMATTACVPCTVLITNGKENQLSRLVFLHCTYQTVAPLSHSIALFPGLLCFYLLFVFTIIHGSGLPLLYILIVNASGRQKQGRPGEQG